MTEAVNILRSPAQAAARDPAPATVQNTGQSLQTSLQTGQSATPAVNRPTVSNKWISCSPLTGEIQQGKQVVVVPDFHDQRLIHINHGSLKIPGYINSFASPM